MSTDWQQQPAETLLEGIARAGITGMGGGGFPTAQKLAAARSWQAAHPGQPVTFIANAVACEPGIDADLFIADQAPADVLLGIRIVAHVLELTQCTLALGQRTLRFEDGLQAHWRAQQEALTEPEGSTLTLHWFTATGQPAAGAERLLIEAVTGTALACSEPPATQGYVVQNATTLWAIARAIGYGEPLQKRPITVGDKTDWVAIGTPIAELPGAAACNRYGGPWSGEPLAVEQPVTAHTLAVHNIAPVEPSPCIGCGDCAVVCPVALDPEHLERLVGSLPSRALTVTESQSPRSPLTALQKASIDECIECGACNVSCPSAIDLLGSFRRGKAAVAEARETLRRARRAKERYARHQERLARRAAASDSKRAHRLAKRRSWANAKGTS